MNSLSGKKDVMYFLHLDFCFVPSQLLLLAIVIGLSGVQFALIIQVINTIRCYTFRGSEKGQKLGERCQIFYDFV